MDLNTEANKNSLICTFPNLDKDPHFKITSPRTSKYNCIAWAMGFDSRWVQGADYTFINTVGERFVWWPEGIDNSGSKQALIDAFTALGFEQTDNPYFEEDYDKAVLYAVGDEWKHASRIVSDDCEHSKFGDSWDAMHGRNKFEGSIYGTPYAYMRRSHALKQHFIDLHPIKLGTISVNEAQLKKILPTIISLLKRT